MTPHSTYRHSVEAKKLLAKIAHQWGITRTAALEFMIRDQARKMGLVKRKGSPLNGPEAKMLEMRERMGPPEVFAFKG